MPNTPSQPEDRRQTAEEYLDSTQPHWREYITLLPANTPQPSPNFRGFPGRGEVATLPAGTIGHDSTLEHMESEAGELGGLFVTKAPIQGTVGPNRSITSRELGHFYVIALPREE